MPMLDAGDAFNIMMDAYDTRNDYREAVMVYPNITKGINYERFSDAPYDISSGSVQYADVTYTTYRAKARIKIWQDTSIIGAGQAVVGLEVGDYLLYFRSFDRQQIERVLKEENAYIVVDGNTLRPNNITLNGVAKAFDVTAHCKKFSPRFRAQGL